MKPRARAGGAAIAIVMASAIVLAPAAARADTPVVVTTEGNVTNVYVAPGDDVVAAPDTGIDPFKKMGVASTGQPLRLSLAPGPYTIETEGGTASSGHATVQVGAEPTRVEVRQGDATLKTFGGILMGLGVASAIGGIIALISLPSSTDHVNKYAIGGALVGGGVAGFGLGLGLSLAGRTHITVVPMGAAGAAAPPPSQP